MDYLLFHADSRIDMKVLVKADGRIICQQGENEAVTIEPYAEKQFSGKRDAANVFCQNNAGRELVNVELKYQFEKKELSWDDADLKDHTAIEKALEEINGANYNEKNEKILTDNKIAFEGEVSISPKRIQTWDFGELKEGEYVRFHSAKGEIAANDKLLQACFRGFGDIANWTVRS